MKHLLLSLVLIACEENEKVVDIEEGTLIVTLMVMDFRRKTIVMIMTLL